MSSIKDLFEKNLKKFDKPVDNVQSASAGAESTEYLIIIGVLALIFSVMLLLTPKAIFSLERQANRVYMTDPTFMKYRIPFGMFLLFSGAFMIYSSIGYF